MVAKLINKVTGRVIEISKGNNITLGRGPSLECFDKRISRQHASFSHFCKDAVSVYVLNTNPCFTMQKGKPPIKILKKNETITLQHGDVISFLPDFLASAFNVVLQNDNGEISKEEPSHAFQIMNQLPSEAIARDPLPTPENSCSVQHTSPGRADNSAARSPDLDVSDFDGEIPIPSRPSLTLTSKSEFLTNAADTAPINKTNGGNKNDDEAPCSPSLLFQAMPSSEANAEVPAAPGVNDPSSPSLIVGSNLSSSFNFEKECKDQPSIRTPDDSSNILDFQASSESEPLRPPTPATPDLIQYSEIQIPHSSLPQSCPSIKIKINIESSEKSLENKTPNKIKAEVGSDSPVNLPSNSNLLHTFRGRRLTDDFGDSSASPAKRQAFSDDASTSQSVNNSHQVAINNPVPGFSRPSSSAVQVDSSQNVIVIKPDPDAPSPKRKLCRYAHSCYRKNAQHKVEFCHPGDPDWIPEQQKPLCPFDPNCYRRCTDHRINFRHTCDRRPYPDHNASEDGDSMDLGTSQDFAGSDEDSYPGDSSSQFPSESSSTHDFSDSGSNFSDAFGSEVAEE